MTAIRESVVNLTFCILFFALSSIAFGQADPPEPGRTQFSLYGMQFVNGGQSVRVAVQNPRLSDREIIPCVKVRVVFDVYEAAGDGSVRLRFERRVLREMELDPGDAATFDFAASRNGDWISPSVLATPEEGDAGPLRLLSTLTIRQFGFTVFNLPIVEKGFDPQPDPPATRATSFKSQAFVVRPE